VILASLDEGHLNVSVRIIMSSQPDMEMVAQAGNAGQAIAEVRLTLMDLSLPGTNGTDTLIAIRGEFPNAQIIMLTMSEGDGEIQRAMRAGAAAYLLKSVTNDQLVAAIRAVHAGRKHVPTEIAARLAEHLGDENLTTRELDVLWPDSRWPSKQADRRRSRDCRDHRELLHQEPAVSAFADELYDAPRSWAEQRIPSSFTTTGSRRTATSPPGSSRSSSAKRFARASDRR
jgi:CheY-like chemotaxis protein